MRIAIFDYKTTSTNPVGSLHRHLVGSLCEEFDFTVFAPEFENPCPARVRYVKVPVPRRPLVLLFVAFHLVAPVCYLVERLRRGRFDIVQMVESNLLIRRDIDYVQFCHRLFLREYWPKVKGRGFRSILRFWDHRLHALFEPRVFRGAGMIVVPSTGVARELAREYPEIEKKVHILSNPIDLERLKRPDDFDRRAMRLACGAADEDTLMSFVALGHFERKGLPLLLEAMQSLANPSLKLVVIGGQSDLLDTYRQRVAAMGLSEQVKFVGMQQDVRQWLWASDVFAFPSSYETFSLVTFQAAGAGLPIIVTRLHGVEEFTIDGRNSLIVETTAASIRTGIERFLALSRESREAMGLKAQQDVSPFSTKRFELSWRAVYADVAAANASGSISKR